MMPPPHMRQQNRPKSPVMIRNVPRQRPEELDDFAGDDDIVCVDDDDFAAEGFIREGGTPREVLMGRRKLAPGSKAPVRNRLGGGSGLVTAKNKTRVPDLMGGASPNNASGASLGERLGMEGSY